MKKQTCHQIKDLKPKIEKRRVLIRLGYKAGKAVVSDSVRDLVDEMIQQGRLLLKPAALYSILDYTDTNRHPVFQNAEKVALCLCTIGQELEKASAVLFQQNEIFKGVILDAVGSEATEDLARQLDKIISGRAQKLGLWPSKRFSPGYGIWEVEEQKFIFSTLPAEEIGIRLTDSYMMIPRKSISFRINFYRDKQLSTRRFGYNHSNSHSSR